MVDFCAMIKYKTLLLFCSQEGNYRLCRQAAVFVIKYNIFNMQDSFILLTNNVIACMGS